MDCFLVHNQDVISSICVNIVSHQGYMISRRTKTKATGLAVHLAFHLTGFFQFSLTCGGMVETD